MQSVDGRLTITFNGEIYNYKALRKGLEERGAAFHSDSDTEVVLHLYAEKGPAMLSDLRGMFAFALWDARERCLLLARDPYGIKPLYIADNGRTRLLAVIDEPNLYPGRWLNELRRQPDHLHGWPQIHPERQQHSGRWARLEFGLLRHHEQYADRFRR